MTSPFLVNGVMWAMPGRADRSPMRINWKTQPETQRTCSEWDAPDPLDTKRQPLNWFAAKSGGGGIGSRALGAAPQTCAPLRFACSLLPSRRSRPASPDAANVAGTMTWPRQEATIGHAPQAESSKRVSATTNSWPRVDFRYQQLAKTARNRGSTSRSSFRKSRARPRWPESPGWN